MNFNSIVKYTPIPTEVSIRQSHCELVKVEWSQERLTALFWVSGNQGVQAIFEEFIRQYAVLDDMLHGSFLDAGGTIGIDPAGFAYSVENGNLSPVLEKTAWSYHDPNVKHYCLVSNSSCLDVVAVRPPVFESVYVENPYANRDD